MIVAQGFVGQRACVVGNFDANCSDDWMKRVGSDKLFYELHTARGTLEQKMCHSHICNLVFKLLKVESVNWTFLQ